MKKPVVIYKSFYGSTKQYAAWIAQALDCDVYDVGKLPRDGLSDYDVIIFGGGLYAGRVEGWNVLRHHLKDAPDAAVVLFTVGLSDTADTAQYQPMLHKMLDEQERARYRVFHLRGGIDYAKLNFKHKSMMKMLRVMLSKKPEAERTQEDQALLDTFGQPTDFSDSASIVPLIEYVRSL